MELGKAPKQRGFRSARPVESAGRRLDEVTRTSRIGYLRELARAYRPMGMGLIVKQALVGHTGMEDLTDDELIGLHRDMDRARECISDGITFEEAGLLRSQGEAA